MKPSICRLRPAEALWKAMSIDWQLEDHSLLLVSDFQYERYDRRGPSGGAPLLPQHHQGDCPQPQQHLPHGGSQLLILQKAL